MSDEQAQVKAAKTAAFYGLLYYFPRALAEVAKVSMFGAGKHKVPLTDRGFLSDKYPLPMFDDAEVRHILARAVEGEVNKEDGNMLHRAQAAWNALAGLEKLLILLEEHEKGKLKEGEEG